MCITTSRIALPKIRPQTRFPLLAFGIWPLQDLHVYNNIEENAPCFRRSPGRTRGANLDLSFDLDRQLLGAHFCLEAQHSPTPGRGRKKPPKTDQVLREIRVSRPDQAVKIAPHFRRSPIRTRGGNLDLSFDLSRQLQGAHFCPEAQQSPTPGRGRKKPPKTDQVFTGNRRPFSS